jgi:hypothetical protein
VGPGVKGDRGGVGLGARPKCGRESEGLRAGVGRIDGVDSGSIPGVF